MKKNDKPLMTEELEKRFKEIGKSNRLNSNPLVAAKYYLPATQSTFYALEYDPKSKRSWGIMHGKEDDFIKSGEFDMDEEKRKLQMDEYKLYRDLEFKEELYANLEPTHAPMVANAINTIKERLSIRQINHFQGEPTRREKLITDKLKARFKEVGSQSDKADPLVIARFYDTTGPATWYATEYEPKRNICFGYVRLLPDEIFDEWGSFSVDGLESLDSELGIKIERDIFFIEQPISELVPAIKRHLELQKEKQDHSKLEEEDQEQKKKRGPKR